MAQHEQTHDWAISYATRGWPVFPICPVHDCPWETRCPGGRDLGKHPLLPSGFKGASRDPTQIAYWWSSNPAWQHCNIGVVTGPEPGILVVDVDPDKGGYDTFAQLEATNGQLLTLECGTGGGGSHLYFTWPADITDQQLRNSAGKLGYGVDVRAAGGYVVAPPSLHRSGHRYQWCTAHTEPQPAPPWLLDLLLKPPEPPESPRRRRPNLPFRGRVGGRGYVARALQGECKQLLTVPEGQRHDQLVRSATRIGQLLHLVTTTDADGIRDTLIQTGQDMGLPEKEAVRVIDDQITWGLQHPREPK